MNYVGAILAFVLLCACWGAFQLWLGRQADGTPTDSDVRTCHGCGGVEEPHDVTASTDDAHETPGRARAEKLH